MSIFGDIAEACRSSDDIASREAALRGLRGHASLVRDEDGAGYRTGMLVVDTWRRAQETAIAHPWIVSAGLRIVSLDDLRSQAEYRGVVVFSTDAAMRLALEANEADSNRALMLIRLLEATVVRGEMEAEIVRLRKDVADLTAQIERPGVADEVSDG